MARQEDLNYAFESVYWNKELLPQYNSIYESNHDKWIEHELINLYTDAERQYADANEDFKKHHNKFLFGFFKYFLLWFSFIPCLGIPFYWVWKKYKELKQNFEYWSGIVQDAKNNKLQKHMAILSKLNVTEIFNCFSNVIKYKHCGPVPAALVEEMQDHSLFDLRRYGAEINPFTTSWGIFDNKIIINSAVQTHRSYQKTYTGSLSVPYVDYDSEGNAISKTAVVSATYTHPAYDISMRQNSYAFMQSCSNLEFNAEGKKGMLDKKYEQKRNYASLENDKFDKKFKWYRSDDVQFRMVFTPYTQEAYLEELNGRKDMPAVLDWAKSSTFMYNSYDTVGFPHLLDRNISNALQTFAVNADISLEGFKQNLFAAIKGYYFNIYSALNFMYLTTIMPSEDHTNMIKAVNKQLAKVNNKNGLFFAHNILRESLDVNIIIRDTPCFDTLLNIQPINSTKHGDNIFISSFSGLSYDMVEKVIYIPTYCYQAEKTVDVPVTYIDYIPHTACGKTACATLNNSNLFFYSLFSYGLQSNIQDDKICELLNDLKSKYRTCLRSGTLSLYIPEENFAAFEKEDQAKLIEVVSLLDKYEEK